MPGVGRAIRRLTADKPLTQGDHQITVLFFDTAGPARVVVGWSPLVTETPAGGVVVSTPSQTPSQPGNRAARRRRLRQLLHRQAARLFRPRRLVRRRAPPHPVPRPRRRARPHPVPRPRRRARPHPVPRLRRRTPLHPVLHQHQRANPVTPTRAHPVPRPRQHPLRRPRPRRCVLWA